MKKAWNANTGKPIAKEGFMKWTDISTDRLETIIHNFFGETLQLHQDYLLDDTLKNRPVIVEYRWWINYIVESLVIILFIIGVWVGRKNRFLWLVLSCFAFDAILHLGLGFGINEVYIMGPHWLFVLPIAISYIFRQSKIRWCLPLRIISAALAVFIFLWNISLFVYYTMS